jgi:hypothetical protein
MAESEPNPYIQAGDAVDQITVSDEHSLVDVASVRARGAEGARGSGSSGRSTPEGVHVRRQTAMNRLDFSNSDSGVFCMERKAETTNLEQHRKWLKQLRDMPEVRLKKIMKIRAEIAKGTYETEAKWRIALDRLREDLSN